MPRGIDPNEPRNGKRLMGAVLVIIASLTVAGITGTVVGLAKHGEKISALEVRQEDSGKRVDGLEQRLWRIENGVNEILRRMPK